MNPELERFDREILDVEERARQLIRDLTDRQASWRPSPRAWSIAQCLDHVVLAAQRYLPRADKAIARAREAGLLGDGPYRYRSFDRWVIRHLEPPPKYRVRTTRPYVPIRERPRDEMLSDFIRVHEEVRHCLRRADGVDLARTWMRHPTIWVFWFSLGTGFGIFTAHARRHLWQADQVRSDPSFPERR